MAAVTRCCKFGVEFPPCSMKHPRDPMREGRIGILDKACKLSLYWVINIIERGCRVISGSYPVDWFASNQNLQKLTILTVVAGNKSEIYCSFNADFWYHNDMAVGTAGVCNTACKDRAIDDFALGSKVFAMQPLCSLFLRSFSKFLLLCRLSVLFDPLCKYVNELMWPTRSWNIAVISSPNTTSYSAI